MNESRWGDQLAQAHNVVRRQVAAARAEPASLTEQLRIHCQTVCAYLHGHHTGEGDVFFPHLAQRYPELGPVLDRLRSEHAVVDRILSDLDALSSAGDVERARAELDRLAVELDEHFAYEEEHLVPALNTLTGPVPWEDPA